MGLHTLQSSKSLQITRRSKRYKDYSQISTYETRMNSAVRGFILLACIAVCSSAAIIPNCQCVATIPGVHPSQITAVKNYPPRPYCRRHEVIVTLKDKTTHCLDPEQLLTKRILEREAMRRAKMNATRTKITTVPATPPATVFATEVSTTL